MILCQEEAEEKNYLGAVGVRKTRARSPVWADALRALTQIIADSKQMIADRFYLWPSALLSGIICVK
ncbi:MAG: hypothetical protein M0R48_09560 [Candidatus Omnitrophica bacterium]|jgi:hypothetical protein|nr:hypothetical protein [Candidatus Omnitrophota bacterium]